MQDKTDRRESIMRIGIGMVRMRELEGMGRESEAEAVGLGRGRIDIRMPGRRHEDREVRAPESGSQALSRGLIPGICRDSVRAPESGIRALTPGFAVRM